LDYDVRFGQGFLFSPPRPVRAEALLSADAGKTDTGDQAKRDAAAPRGAGLAQLARTGSGRP
jgi:cyclic-di-GMP phosphodiesterase TipF (flagellum assembly factor)